MQNKTLLDILSRYEPDQIFVLADARVSLPCLSGYPTLSIPVSESVKTLDTVCQIWDFLITRHATRRGLLICLGGGVITDLGGFAASTYHRGMHYLNIPSTLLAMVDAGIGGKTGFNYRGMKNAIGNIHMPVDTLFIPELLHTLSHEQWLCGFAEMLKTALLDSETVFHDVLQAIEEYASADSCFMDHIPTLIKQIANIKQEIVKRDLHEEGVRKVLNLGHTFGHALEELSMEKGQYMPHGYAVMYGLIAALYLSTVTLQMNREPLRQITHQTVTYYGRPNCPCKDFDRLVTLMQDDKKNDKKTTIHFTLLRKIGEPVINQIVPTAQIKEALEYLFSV